MPSAVDPGDDLYVAVKQVDQRLHCIMRLIKLTHCAR
jgi:hypothetical protein